MQKILILLGESVEAERVQNLSEAHHRLRLSRADLGTVALGCFIEVGPALLGRHTPELDPGLLT